MKEYEDGFTTRAAKGEKALLGNEIEIYTNKENIVMRIEGNEFEVVNMSVKEAKLLCSMLTEAIKKVNSRHN